MNKASSPSASAVALLKKRAIMIGIWLIPLVLAILWGRFIDPADTIHGFARWLLVVSLVPLTLEIVSLIFELGRVRVR